MRGLVPRIRVFVRCQDVDGRVKPGHDDFNLIGKCFSFDRRYNGIGSEPLRSPTCGGQGMQVFDLKKEQEWNPKHHVEKILGEIGEGDVTVACWEPGQISPNHCHPHATEIYFCFEGGGQMRTPRETIDVLPGSFVVHPPGELHEYSNGPSRTLLFRVRYGTDMSSRHFEWRGNAQWKQAPRDAEYFRAHPPA
jgi:quercetin dioxygenase-like cupin family protein